MTKMELVNRIRDITARSDLRTKSTLMDCVEGFAETLLSRVKLETEMAVQTAVTNAMARLRLEGREE